MKESHEAESPSAGKWALVAGASGGVGSAVARRLAQDGWNLHLLYRSNREAVDKVAKAAADSGSSTHIHQADLVDAEVTKESVLRAHASAPLAAVVYAAGPHIPMHYIADHSPETFSRTIDADLKACFHLLQPALVPLRETQGAILAVTTPAMDRYPKRDILSAVPKSGIRSLIRGIASEEGRFGVRANSIAVGLLEGPGMWDELIARGDYTPEVLDVARRNIPLRRFGDVTDIADAARFLLSAEAKWVTGQTLAVDGGYSV